MSLSNAFIASTVYNSLPHISDNFEVPSKSLDALSKLRGLLVKYDVPQSIGIRLVHKHFDAQEGEVMAFKTIQLPSYGTVETMRPLKDLDKTKLYPIHYLVTETGDIQAYEYSDRKSHIPVTENFEAFLAEFSAVILAQGLQSQFGLKVDCDADTDVGGESAQRPPLRTVPLSRLPGFSNAEQINTSLTEFEFPEKRGTILVRDGMPMPDCEGEVTVTTEWYGSPFRQSLHCTHVKSCKHCTHCKKHRQNGACVGEAIQDDTLFFGGHALEAGTPFHHFVSQMVSAW